MDFEKYKNTMLYPERPEKPQLPRKATPSSVRAFADQLEQYEKNMEIYRNLQWDHNKESARLDAQFKADALEEVGLTGHPRADKAYAYAWQEGHSGGYSEVFNHLLDIAGVLKD